MIGNVRDLSDKSRMPPLVHFDFQAERRPREEDA